MEIRQNPYEDLDDGGLDNFQDRSVDLNDAPLEDLTGITVTKPKVVAPKIPPLGQSVSASNLNMD